jgi:hypothetical protein
MIGVDSEDWNCISGSVNSLNQTTKVILEASAHWESMMHSKLCWRIEWSMVKAG